MENNQKNPKSEAQPQMMTAEFARLTGVCTKTVRRYTQKGIIPNRRHPINNYRIFTMDDVNRLKAFKRGMIISK